MFTMTNRIEFASLDSTTIEPLSKMMYFPAGVDKLTYVRKDTGFQELIFETATEHNTLVATLAFFEGNSYDIAMLLDALPIKLFIDAPGFMSLWMLGGFDAAIAFDNRRKLVLEITPDMVAA